MNYLNKQTTYKNTGLFALAFGAVAAFAAVVVDRKLIRDRGNAKPENKAEKAPEQKAEGAKEAKTA